MRSFCVLDFPWLMFSIIIYTLKEAKVLSQGQSLQLHSTVREFPLWPKSCCSAHNPKWHMSQYQVTHEPFVITTHFSPDTFLIFHGPSLRFTEIPHHPLMKLHWFSLCSLSFDLKDLLGCKWMVKSFYRAFSRILEQQIVSRYPENGHIDHL